MTGIARASHYPQPPPAATVLAGDRCEHGELDGRCPLCRRAAEPPDEPEPASPEPPQPIRPVVVDGGDDDDQDPRSVPWWDR
jgi:hypothetical protein